MIDYAILGCITVSDSLNEEDSEIFENFFDEYILINHNFKMFEDCIGGVENVFSYRYDGTEDLEPLYMPSVNTWYFNENDGQNFLLCDFSDYNEFPISTLHYIYNNFLVNRGIEMDGEIVALDFDSSKVLVYNVADSIFMKHINKSENYTNFWKQCLNNNFDDCHKDLLSRYYTLEQLSNLTPFEIFEHTYTNFEY